jgi:hypothetical protein
MTPTKLHYYGTDPLSIIITGGPFEDLEGVYINGYRCPEIFQRSKTSLIVQVPDQASGDKLRSLSILSYSLSSGDAKSAVKLEMGRRTKYVTGIMKLMQVFVLRLLQTPGSDIFDKSSGGGLLALIGQTGNSKKESAASQVMEAISITQKQIIAKQASLAIPNEEKLLYARVTSIGFTPETAVLKVTIELANMAGNAVSTQVSNITGSIPGVTGAIYS